MPELKKFTPVLRVKDLPAALSFYRRLGFAIDFEHKFAENEKSHYAGLSRDGQSLHLSTFEENGQTNTLVFATVEDIDGLYKELTDADVTCRTPEDMSWGQREMTVRDLDGNALRFAMPI